MNIDSIKRRLLIKYPFFGSILANSNFISTLSIETAGTDGKDIYYNPGFIENLTSDQQIFIVAHEICHIAFNHIFRSEGKEQKIWNIATDSVINAFLKQDGLPIVKGGVDIPDAIHYDAEEMYNKLLKEKQEEQSNNGQGNSQKQHDKNQSNEGSLNSSSSSNDFKNNQEQTSSTEDVSKNQENNFNSNSSSKNDLKKEIESNDVGHDTHSMWDKAIQEKQKKQSSKNNQKQHDKNQIKESSLSSSSGSNNLKNKNNQEQTSSQNSQNDVTKNQENNSDSNSSSKNDSKKETEIDKLTKLGEKEAFKQNRIERAKQIEELRESLARQSHSCGSDTNGEVREVKNIGTSKPLIDWRRLLKEAIKYDVDWSYQNAGIEEGVVTAYLEEQPKPETEIVLDTSGSVDTSLLRNFLRECKNILQTSKVKVGCFDTKFYGFTEIRDISDIDNLSFCGGGGTNFNAAVNAFTKRVENKIIFTDGEAEMPRKSMDAIWVVFGNKKIKPAGGKVINIDSEQLKKLSNYEIDNDINIKTR